ncbi:MAG: Fur family transcriptional regulator [Chloroflexota bacterium]
MIIPSATSPDTTERDERLKQLLVRLRRSGYRLSAARRAVLEALVHSSAHPGAEDLYRQVVAEHPALSRATVYKTLDLLRGLGEVLELEFRDSRIPANRYDGMRPNPHPHLVCVRCGRIDDVLLEAMDAQVSQAAGSAGYALERFRFDVYGTCPQCQGADAPGTA